MAFETITLVREESHAIITPAEPNTATTRRPSVTGVELA